MLERPSFWGSVAFAFMLGMIGGYLVGAYRGFSPADGAAGYGNFPTTAKSEWLPDGRTMRLLEDFAYIDKNGKAWAANKGDEVDGASIPQMFWTVVGSPLTGKYRDASIVHDVECDRRSDDCDAVHRMFYEACLCRGVTPNDAMILYGAVFHFGPRWAFVTEVRTMTTDAGEEKRYEVSVPVNVAMALPDEVAQQKLVEYIKKNNPTPEQVEKLDLNTL